MQQPMIIQPAPISNKVTSYKSNTSHLLGGLQIAIGVISIILDVVGILTTWWYAYFEIGHGIWAGVFFIITGAFGLGAGCTKKKCLIVAFMVLSILSAALFVLAMGAVSAIALDSMEKDNYQYMYPDVERGKSFGLNCAMLGLAVSELIVAVSSAIICCQAVCCGSSQQPAGQVFCIQTTASIQGQASGQPQFILQQPIGQRQGEMVCVPPPYISQQGGVQSGNVLQPANIPQHGVVFQTGQIIQQQVASNQTPATAEALKQPV